MTRFLPFGSRSRAIQVNTLGGSSGGWIPRDWLVAEYLLATNSLDTSGNGYDGTLVWTASISWGALNTTNSNYMSIPSWTNSASGISSTYSRSIWFKTSNASQFNFLISNEWPSVPYTWQAYYLTTTWKLTIDFLNNFATSRYISETSTSWYNDGNWHNFIFTYDWTWPSASSMKVYIDGVQATMTNTLNTIGSNDWANVQSSYVWARLYEVAQWFIGSFKKIRLYNRVLNAGEIAALYAEG